MGCFHSKVSSSSVSKADQALVLSKSFSSDAFKTVDYRLISSIYTITPKILGAGNFGKVFLAYNT
jgi:hypothetical protein